MASKEGGCHYAPFITAALKPGANGDLIPCHAGAVPGAEREGGSFSYPGYPWTGNQSLLGLEAGRVLSLWPCQAIKVLGSSRSSPWVAEPSCPCAHPSLGCKVKRV